MFCQILHIVLTLHYWSLFNSLNLKRNSIMMIVYNCTQFNFLLIKTTSFMKVWQWCYLKDNKKLLIKMDNIFLNKLISLPKKNDPVEKKYKTIFEKKIKIFVIFYYFSSKSRFSPKFSSFINFSVLFCVYFILHLVRTCGLV